MRNRIVYFEIFGKKMKFTVLSKSDNDAKLQIIKKIIFHKIEIEKEPFNESMNFIDDFISKIK